MRRKKGANVEAGIGASQPNATAGDTPPPAKKIKYSVEEVPPLPPLTVREQDVLYWVARGKENAEIAGILHASPETIRKHVQNIRQKFSSESRLAIIARYWERQLYESNLLIKERDEMIERLRRQQQSGKG